MGQQGFGSHDGELDMVAAVDGATFKKIKSDSAVFKIPLIWSKAFKTSII